MNEKYQTMIKITVILILLVIVIKLCLIFLWPFLAALLIVFLLEPLVVMIIKVGINRKLSVIISLGIIIIFIALIIIYLSQYIYKQMLNIIENYSVILNVVEKHFTFLKLKNIDYEDIIKTAQNLIVSSREQIYFTIINTFNGIVYTVLIAMSTIFISFDLDNFKELFQKWLPDNVYKLWSNIIRKIGKILFVELKLIIITTVQTIIGLFLLGINNSLTIGIICGILDLLPIVGPTVIFVPYILYELITGRTAIAIGLVILYILLQISREFIKAKLVGENLKIHPFVAIFSIYLGVLFFGMSGVIVGPTLIVVISELSSLVYK